MSVFDPNHFLQQTVEGGNFETRVTPIDEGEYPAVIDAIDIKTLTKSGIRYVAELRWSIMDENVKAKLGLPKVTVRQSVFLDIDEAGRYEKGPNKNVQLGRVRDAVGQGNVNPWALAMLQGAGPAKVKITKRPDDKDPTIVYNDVAAVTKFAA
jgi:hypothetical protein